MSSRAIASQKTKRTIIPPNKSNNSNNNSTQQQSISNNNDKKPLSIQEAFSLINNKVTNLEKAVFEGDFTRPEPSTASDLLSKKNEQRYIELSQQINEIKEHLYENNNSSNSNPYTSLNTATSFDTINAELLMMKNDILSTRSAIQRVDLINDDINNIKNNIHQLQENNNDNSTNYNFETITDNVNELKDMIIKLQNFTLEINDMCLRNLKMSSFEQFMNENNILDEQQNIFNDNIDNGIVIGDDVEHIDEKSLEVIGDDIEHINDNSIEVIGESIINNIADEKNNNDHLNNETIESFYNNDNNNDNVNNNDNDNDDNVNNNDNDNDNDNDNVNVFTDDKLISEESQNNDESIQEE